jgi:drug/metabolite transporter, DME family
MERRSALIAVVASAACFGTLGVLAKVAYANGAEPLPLLTWRFVAASLLIAGWQALRDRRELAVTWGDVGRYSLLSVSGYGAASLCYFFGVQESGAAVTTVLLYTYPAIVTVIGWAFLGESLPWTKVAAVTLTFVGCALVADVVGGAGTVSTKGILLGLGAGLGYAVFNVLSYRWMDRRPRPVLLAYTLGISALLVGAIGLAARVPMSVATWNQQAWIAFWLIVLVPTFAAVILYLRGMKGLGPSQAAIVSTLEPIFAIALAASFVNEVLSPLQLAGAAIVLGGVVLAEWGRAGVAPDEVAGV